MNVIEAIIFGFSEILSYKVLKRALAIGAAVVIVWSVIGYLLWGPLVSFAAYFLDLIPFSMLRANGAWMLSIFLWSFLVLITFALVMAFFGNVILEKVSKEKYGSTSVLIVLGSAVVWGIVWFIGDGYIHEQFSKLLTYLPFETVEGGLAYLMALYFIYTGIIITLLFVTSMMSESLLHEVQEQEFPYESLLDEDEVEAAKSRILDVSIYVLVSVAAFPLLFIPVVNFVVQLLLWVWLIKDTFLNDTKLLVIPQAKREGLSAYKAGFITLAGVTAMFNFIPILNVFGPFFGEISMFYYLKQIEKEL
jgi:hypothetical protein